MTVAVVGEALVDLIADDSGGFRPCLGGSPFNVAIGLARQGVGVHYLSALSEDHFGEALRAALEREDVAVPLRRRSRYPTSLAIVRVDAHGQPGYRLYREGVADKDTSLEEVVGNLPDDLSLLHTGSLAITPSQLPVIRGVIDVLQGRGVPVSVDINLRRGASRDPAAYVAGVRSLLPMADIIKASDEDLAALGYGGQPRAAAEAAFSDMGGGILVLTEGERGATLFSAAGAIEQAAFRVAEVADTVGAGDSFHAAFLSSLHRAGLLAALPAHPDSTALAAALEFASAAAAINVSQAGCSPPTARQVREFLANVAP